MEAGTAALGDENDLAGPSLIGGRRDRRQRHRLRSGRAEQTKADSKGRSSKDLHRDILSFKQAAVRGGSKLGQVAGGQGSLPTTKSAMEITNDAANDDGASGDASPGADDASPNGGGANAGASDGPSAPLAA
jgi:hypothetical protein